VVVFFVLLERLRDVDAAHPRSPGATLMSAASG